MCRAMCGCTPAAKISVYKGLVRPHLEYACVVWSPYTSQDIVLLDRSQCNIGLQTGSGVFG